MTDESLPGLHDMLTGLPKARVPFEQATEATYGRLYEAYEKFKALYAEAEAGRDQALIDLETAKGWRDEALDERDKYRREAAEYRQANTLLQEINTLRTAERDRFRRALELIGTDCETYTGPATCVEDPGRRPDAEYTADRWCDGCIARTAQSIRADERERIAEGFRRQASRYEEAAKAADTLGKHWSGTEQAMRLRDFAECIERGTYEQL
jgi:hypothetical protein